MHRQLYKGCPFECNLAEITQNETVWRMRTNNVKRVYWKRCVADNPSVIEFLYNHRRDKTISGL